MFNNHDYLEGKHAFLSPSGMSWLNYDEDKLRERYTTRLAAAHGTRLHEFAKECILLKQKLPRSERTLNRYVNDAIGFGMTPEQPLFFSFNCFGTADAIKFTEKTMELLISDLKNGIHRSSMRQLEIYSAIFCLEYGYEPEDLTIVLRIYQNDEVRVHTPVTEDIKQHMETIRAHDRVIEVMNREAN